MGSIKIDWFRTLQNKYGSETHLGNLDQEPSYSDGYYLDDFSNSTKEQRLNVICIESIDTSFQAYKGVGSVLMQAAMEYGYSKGCEGRLLTNAVRNASPFYYKLGMRSRHDIDNKMLKSVAKKPRLSHDFGKIDMWMTPLAIQEWKEKIREKPLFVSTSQHLGSKAVTASNVLDLFSEKDRKIDHDLINNFLKRIKQEEKTAHLDPEKAYDFLNLFPQETRIVAMGKLMKVLSEHPKDFTNLLEQKFLEIAGTTLDKRLFSFAGQEGVQAVAARMQNEESPLREIDNEFLSLFSKEDKDQNFKTIIKLEGWIMSQENLDRDNYNRYYLYRDRVVNLLNLFPEEIRIAASNKIMQLSDTDLELFNDKGFLKIQLLENIKKTPSENRLKFLENYLSLKTQ